VRDPLDERPQRRRVKSIHTPAMSIAIALEARYAATRGGR
jgi:hypothetical protein